MRTQCGEGFLDVEIERWSPNKARRVTVKPLQDKSVSYRKEEVPPAPKVFSLDDVVVRETQVKAGVGAMEVDQDGKELLPAKDARLANATKP